MVEFGIVEAASDLTMSGCSKNALSAAQYWVIARPAARS